MKELLLSFAGHNAWANNLLLQTMRPLDAALLEREVVSSFPSLRQTLLHILDAESLWWQRLQLQEKMLRPSEGFTGDLDALTAALQKTDGQWVDFVGRSGEHVFRHTFIYRDSKRVQHKSAVGDVLLHLFNHSTFHRGQLITMLRQLGVTKLPATDYIAWTRK